ALEHEWLREPLPSPIGVPGDFDLLHSVRTNFNARKTFKKAIDTVKAINHLRTHSRNHSLANLLETSKKEADEDVANVFYVE
ncbi:805_t:CDS:1, partial [Racocetra persica]